MVRFEDLIEKHHDEIFAYLWRLLGKNGRRDGAMDVEDLAQDAFLRAYRGFPGLRPNSNHRAWLYKIATNCAYTRLKQINNRRVGIQSFEQVATTSDNGSAPIFEEAEEKIRLLVSELPPKQKACLTLRYLQELDYPDIARILGCSPDSIRANVYQAIRRLRRSLQEDSAKKI